MASDIDRNYFSDNSNNNNINSVHSSHHSLNFSGHSDEDSSNDEFIEEPFSPLTLRPVKTIADKQDQMNLMFGIKPFTSVITTKIKVKHAEATKQRDLLVQKIGNILWVIFCGWWMSIIYCLVGGLLFLTYVGRFYGSNCFKFAKYYLWPFERFVMVESFEKKDSHFSCTPTYALWAIIAWPILSIVHSISWIMCWAGIVSIPMAKLNERALQIMLRNDWHLLMVSKDTTTNSEVLLYIISAINLNYTSYTIGGMNIILVNMLPFVFFTLLVSYVPYFLGITVYPTLIFVLCLISIIPLSYYLGFALASLSAQTSFAVGAILNATFGSLIELILYFFALSTGSLNSLVQAGITGTLLAMMLLLPGLSMIFGGIKYKEQRFNPAAAGVSSILLLLSVVGAFTPTIFYQAYGHFVMSCFECSYSDSTYTCEECTWSEGNLDSDLTYVNGAKPLMYVCGAILPISYLIGLIFTLKTHAHVIDNTEFETHEESGPAPLWTKKKCIVMLLIGITLFSLVAEAMVTSLEPTLEKIGLSQVFAGFTIFALIPSVAEIVNAIQFALANKFSMSLEIGNSAAIQVSLIQMPILILFGALVSPNNASAAFTLIFPLLDLFAVLISVIIVNYISIDGKANYFLGCALVICYVLISASFYFVT